MWRCPPTEIGSHLQADAVPFAGEKANAGTKGRAGEGPKEIPGPLCVRQDEHFDASAANLSSGRNARGNHPGDVPDQQVTRPEKRREIRELQVRHPTVGAEVQQARIPALRGRLLRDEFAGQLVREVGSLHLGTGFRTCR